MIQTAVKKSFFNTEGIETQLQANPLATVEKENGPWLKKCWSFDDSYISEKTGIIANKLLLFENENQRIFSKTLRSFKRALLEKKKRIYIAMLQDVLDR